MIPTYNKVLVCFQNIYCELGIPRFFITVTLGLILFVNYDKRIIELVPLNTIAKDFNKLKEAE